MFRGQETRRLPPRLVARVESRNVSARSPSATGIDAPKNRASYRSNTTARSRAVIRENCGSRMQSDAARVASRTCCRRASISVDVRVLARKQSR